MDKYATDSAVKYVFSFFRVWTGFNWLSLGVAWQAFTHSVMDLWAPKQVQECT